MLGYGDFDTTMNVIAKAVEKGPWLMGEQFTAADVVIGANIRWGMIFKMIPARKEFTDYAARIAARPAAQRAEAKDKSLAARPA
jgi:glutathione S-transferase